MIVAAIVTPSVAIVTPTTAETTAPVTTNIRCQAKDGLTCVGILRRVKIITRGGYGGFNACCDGRFLGAFLAL